MAGIYPMLLDGPAIFSLSTLTRHIGKRMRALTWTHAAGWIVPAALERSRSGNGGHVWLFFAEAISAALARRLGAHILTETLERRPEVGMDS